MLRSCHRIWVYIFFRIGRTGRIGHKGMSATLFVKGQVDRNFVNDLIGRFEKENKPVPEVLRSLGSGE